MTFEALLQEQWRGYAQRHSDRVNLLIHIVAVPLFWLGTLEAVSDLLFTGLFAALGGVALMALALFLQGLGHDRENVQPEPFSSAWDFTQRIVAEQFVNFPRFVINGDWWRQLQLAT